MDDALSVGVVERVGDSRAYRRAWSTGNGPFVSLCSRVSPSTYSMTRKSMSS